MNKLYIVLDNVKYAQNIGPVFRLAEGFGVEKIFLCKENTHKLNHVQERILYKASRGAINRVDWEFKNSCFNVVNELKDNGVQIVCIETGKDSKSIYEASYNTSTAFVFGSEDDGISQDVLKLSDNIIKIPMLGQGKSLNISTCVSIAVYDFYSKQNRE
jgi:tRNA G18 (ribose-2'-O)-methylase SpoU